MGKYCSNCGAPLEDGAEACNYCGVKIMNPQRPNPQQTQQPFQTGTQFHPGYYPGNNATSLTGYDPGMDRNTGTWIPGINPFWPKRNKIVAGVLALVLGTFGIHKFYLRRYGWGILYLLFFGTGIPTILGLIEGVMYLCTDDAKFQLKYQVRLR